jgi:hypothetical protein
MFTIIYDSNPGPYVVTRPQLSPGFQARSLAFWLGADAEPAAINGKSNQWAGIGTRTKLHSFYPPFPHQSN